jgi:tetratricopeptide (TPR) repeat protein
MAFLAWLCRVLVMRHCLLLIIGVFALTSCVSQGTSATASQPKPGPAVAARDSSNETIRFLEARLVRDPEDFIALNKLASAYLQQVRETGDITYLDLASRAATRSISALPAEQNKGGLAVLTQVEFSSHDFVSARRDAERLIEIDPGKGYTYQLLGDALGELGEYEQAERAFQKMRELGGVQALTKVAVAERLSRLATLRGHQEDAKRYLERAEKELLSMPEPAGEPLAWCKLQMGETEFALGHYPRAERYYRESLEIFPGYFKAIAALGRVRAAQGDLNGAIEHYEKVVKMVPDPGFVASLGDLYKLAGRDADADRQYALVEQIGHLSEITGTLYNRQLACFYADHDLKAEEAYQDAVNEYRIRRDVYGADTLAWTAFKAGKVAEAQDAIGEALKLGTRDARLFYHAGMIAKAGGKASEAKAMLDRALSLSPGFDPLQASRARAGLSELSQN